jgi:hypothetical protein
MFALVLFFAHIFFNSKIMEMKTCWCAICALWLGFALNGQSLAEWSFENVTSAIASTPIQASYTAPSCSGANAYQSGGSNVGTPAVCSGQNTWATNFWSTSDTYSSGIYLEFSLTAKTMDLLISDFSFSSSLSSSSGPKSFAVSYYTSVGKFGLLTYGGFGAGGCSGDGVGLGIVLPKGARIALRIHPYRQDPAAMAATLRIDDVQISGSQFLPINLVDFSAVEKPNQTVSLQWETATETNVEYTSIERSADGMIFEEIGRLSGQGDSFEARHYQFLDSAPRFGCNYYRLKIVDLDGTVAWSGIQAVCFDQVTLFPAKVYPNPTNDKLHVILPFDLEQVDLALLDFRGKNWPVRRNGNQLDLAGMPEGMYILQWKSQNAIGAIKIKKN